jgi:hypothetical protein
MIEKVTVYKTDFCDLFKHAEKHFGISWNEANDLFFNNVIPYQGHHFVWAEEWPDSYEVAEDDRDRGTWILRHFLLKNGVPEFEEVLMDCG